MSKAHARADPCRLSDYRGAPDLLPCWQPRELDLDEVEIVLDHGEVVTSCISLTQGEAAFGSLGFCQKTVPLSLMGWQTTMSALVDM